MFDLSAYTFALALGAAVALVIGAAYARQAGAPRGLFWTVAFGAVAIGLVGARLGHVAQNRVYYDANPDEVWNFAQGGLSWHTGLLAGLLAVWLWARFPRLWPWGRAVFWKLADAAALGLPLALCIGWAGAAAVGAYYGALNDSVFARELPDQFGIYDVRFPVPWAACAWYGLVFLLQLFQAWPRRRGTAERAPLHHRLEAGGRLWGLFLIASAAGDFGLAFLRGESLLTWQGLRVDQWLDLLILLLGAAILALRHARALPHRAARQIVYD